MQQTKIGWTDFSANLLKYRDAEGKTVWACVHASEGCRNCYSEALAKRWGRGKPFTAESMKSLTPYFDVDEANKILGSKKIAGKKVFVDDMTDLFGEWVSDETILAHFTTFASRPDVTFQVLTKRAERMCGLLSQWKSDGLTLREGCGAVLPNVHLGVSAEDQPTADKRGFLLQETPAAVRWMSIEPMLAYIFPRLPDPDCDHPSMDGRGPGLWFCNVCDGRVREIQVSQYRVAYAAPIDGIVIGGESGRGYREMPLDAAVSLAHEAKACGVAVYFKQDSGPRPGMQGRIPDDVWAMKEWPTAA